ncbi:n-lysine methyltransferase smyd2 [Neofusicoccum parvum]|uniref:N-lysine methyltransferase smyd2 n=1 Tax=Neofusicoccum parvum TaxID=310453 RepID=A0ACB5SH92_9PEZI|nr:n-lysine methyltransferase smyd2 [Neofusicoccum parvum]
MGFWGERFFQNDRDLDVVSQLPAAPGITDNLYMPEDPDRLRKDLDTGKLDALFCKLCDGSIDAKSPLHAYGLKTVIVVMAAAAMRHGATISDDYRAYIKTALKSRLAMYDRAKKDMAEAITVYQNGVALDIAGKGLLEVMDDSPPSPYRSPSTINLLSPELFAALETVADECNACGKASDELLRCSRCRKAHYCNKECQKKAWKKHMQICHLSS